MMRRTQPSSAARMRARLALLVCFPDVADGTKTEAEKSQAGAKARSKSAGPPPAPCTGRLERRLCPLPKPTLPPYRRAARPGAELGPAGSRPRPRLKVCSYPPRRPVQNSPSRNSAYVRAAPDFAAPAPLCRPAGQTVQLCDRRVELVHDPVRLYPGALGCAPTPARRGPGRCARKDRAAHTGQPAPARRRKVRRRCALPGAPARIRAGPASRQTSRARPGAGMRR